MDHQFLNLLYYIKKVGNIYLKIVLYNLIIVKVIKSFHKLDFKIIFQLYIIIINIYFDIKLIWIIHICIYTHMVYIYILHI